MQPYPEVSLSVGGGRCEVLVKAKALVQEEEARQGRPLSGSGSGGVVPGFLTLTPQQTGREMTGGPEPELALKELAAGTALPCWDCQVHLHLTWMDRDL